MRASSVICVRLLLLAGAMAALREVGEHRGCKIVRWQDYVVRAECTRDEGNFNLHFKVESNFLVLFCENVSPMISSAEFDELEQLLADQLPHRNRTLEMYKIVNCLLPSGPLNKALRLVNASEAKAVTLWNIMGEIKLIHVEGMTKVEKLVIFYSSSNKDKTTMPFDVLSKLPSLNTLILTGKYMDLQSARGLPMLPTLRSLTLGYFKSLPPEALSNTPGVTTLTLTNSKIESVDERALVGLSQLRKLYLDNNQLSSLPRALLRACPLLEEVNLSHNALTALPAELFAGLAYLREVEISHNRAVLQLPDSLFSSPSSLEHLDLQHSSIQNFPDYILQNTTNLKNLYLSDNELKSIPGNAFHSLMRLQILDLSKNTLQYLHQNLFAKSNTLENLNLRNNYLMDFPEGVFSGLKMIKVINLGQNRIEALDKAVFRGLKTLTELYLDMNSVRNLHPATFSHSVLRVLSLAHNNITISRKQNTIRSTTLAPYVSSAFELDGDYYFSPLYQITEMERLDLQHNHVSLMCDDWRMFGSLTELNLAHNELTELTVSDMEFNSNNVQVDLTLNHITHFQPKPFLNFTGNKPTFVLTDNPITCDCRLYPYIHMKQLNAIAIRIEIGNPVCTQPMSLYNVHLATLNPDQLICNATNCPDKCTCIDRPSRNRTEVDCLQLPSKLPDYTTTHLRLHQSADLSQLPSHVKYVNLSSLNLTELPKISNSVEIDLTNNLFTKIPSKLLELNFDVHLSNNPFDCRCDNKAELEFLKSKHSLVKDFNNITCENKLLFSGIDLDILCTYREATIIGCSFVFLGVLIAGVTGLSYRYKTLIRILLRKNGMWWGEDEIDDRTYDAFISFSHQDESYVLGNLVPSLESGKRPLKLCIHCRDWIIGDFIPSQITKSVEDSRRTIIVLSENFLQSVWAQMEFRAAHGRERLLILMLEDLAADKLDPDLKAYITANTYIKADDPLVYDRLKDAVLTKRRDFVKTKRSADKTAAEIALP